MKGSSGKNHTSSSRANSRSASANTSFIPSYSSRDIRQETRQTNRFLQDPIVNDETDLPPYPRRVADNFLNAGLNCIIDLKGGVALYNIFKELKGVKRRPKDIDIEIWIPDFKDYSDARICELLRSLAMLDPNKPIRIDRGREGERFVINIKDETGLDISIYDSNMPPPSHLAWITSKDSGKLRILNAPSGQVRKVRLAYNDDFTRDMANQGSFVSEEIRRDSLQSFPPYFNINPHARGLILRLAFLNSFSLVGDDELARFLPCIKTVQPPTFNSANNPIKRLLQDLRVPAGMLSEKKAVHNGPLFASQIAGVAKANLLNFMKDHDLVGEEGIALLHSISKVITLHPALFDPSVAMLAPSGVNAYHPFDAFCQRILSNVLIDLQSEMKKIIYNDAAREASEREKMQLADEEGQAFLRQEKLKIEEDNRQQQALEELRKTAVLLAENLILENLLMEEAHQARKNDFKDQILPDLVTRVEQIAAIKALEKEAERNQEVKKTKRDQILEDAKTATKRIVARQESASLGASVVKNNPVRQAQKRPEESGLALFEKQAAQEAQKKAVIAREKAKRIAENKEREAAKKAKIKEERAKQEKAQQARLESLQLEKEAEKRARIEARIKAQEEEEKTRLLQEKLDKEQREAEAAKEQKAKNILGKFVRNVKARIQQSKIDQPIIDEALSFDLEETSHLKSDKTASDQKDAQKDIKQEIKDETKKATAKIKNSSSTLIKELDLEAQTLGKFHQFVDDCRKGKVKEVEKTLKKHQEFVHVLTLKPSRIDGYLCDLEMSVASVTVLSPYSKQSDKVKILKMLMKNQPDLDYINQCQIYDQVGQVIENRDLGTVLHAACEQGSSAMTKEILAAMDLETVNSRNYLGRTPFYSVASQQAFNEDYLKAVMLLLEKGADFSIPSFQGMMPVHFFCHPERLEINNFLPEVRKIFQTAGAMNTNPDGATPLLSACVMGNDKVASIILELYPTLLHVANHSGLTPLQAASASGNLKLVNRLLKRGANAKEINFAGGTDLHLLLTGRDAVNLDIVKSLVRAGVDCNIRDRSGFLALDYAAQRGWDDSVAFLSQHTLPQPPAHAKHDIARNRETKITPTSIETLSVVEQEDFKSFQDSCTSADLEAVRLMLNKHPSFVNVCSKNGANPLAMICLREDGDRAELLEVVKLLIPHTNLLAKDELGNTALMNACIVGNNAIAEVLLQACPLFANMANKDGVTPLQNACLKGNKELVKLLIDTGADVNHCDEANRTALHYIAAYVDHHKRDEETLIAIMEILSDAGIDICALTQEGRSASDYACLSGCYALAKEILKKEGQEIVEDASGQFLDYLLFNMLAQACQEGDLTKVKNIISAHSDLISVRDPVTHETALHYACRGDNVEIVELLIAHQADPFAKTSKGFSPFMVACTSKQFANANYLIDHHKVDVNEVVSGDVLALHVLCTSGELVDEKRDDSIRLIKKVIASQNDLNQQSMLMSPLHMACLEVDADIVALLLEGGADVTMLDYNANSILHIMSSLSERNMSNLKTPADYTQVIELLCAYGADPLLQNGDGKTPMELAREFSPICEKALQDIIRKGMEKELSEAALEKTLKVKDTSHCDDGEDQIMTILEDLDVLEADKLKAIQILVEEGADVGYVSRFGQGLADLAEALGHFEIAQYLLRVQRADEAGSRKYLDSLRAKMVYVQEDKNILLSKEEETQYAQLNKACKDNNLDEVIAITANYPKLLVAVNSLTKENILHQACMNSDIAIVRHLVEACQADRFAIRGNGATPFLLACQKGNFEVANYLFDFGDVNLSDNLFGMQALQMISASTHMNEQQIILAQKIVNQSKKTIQYQSINTLPPLHLACHRANLDMVNLLLTVGQNPNIISSTGVTALTMLISSTIKDDKSADENYSFNQRQILISLIAHGADSALKNGNNQSFEDLAQQAQDEFMPKDVSNLGDDIAMPDLKPSHPNHVPPTKEKPLPEKYHIILRELVSAASQNRLRFGNRLAALDVKRKKNKKGSHHNDISVSQRQQCLDQLLMHVCGYGYLEDANYLIENGANPNCSVQTVATALTQACSLGKFDIANYLLDLEQLDIFYHAAGENSLRQIAKMTTNLSDASTRVVEKLIELGVDPNAMGGDETPLGIACIMGNLDLVKLLLKNGAQVNIRDRGHGDTPIHKILALSASEYEARQGEYEKIIDVLLHAGADLSIVNYYNQSALSESLEHNGGKLGASAQFILSKYRKILDQKHETPLSSNKQKQYDILCRMCHPVDEVNSEKEIGIFQNILKYSPELVMQKEGDKTTLLHRASAAGNDKIVEILLELGADANALNDQGRVAKDYIPTDAENVRILLTSFEDKNKHIFREILLFCHFADSKEMTPEMEGKARDLIARNPAMLTQKDHDGNSLMHYACEYQSPLAAILLEHAASALTKNHHQETPMSIAKNGDNEAFFAFFKTKYLESLKKVPEASATSPTNATQLAPKQLSQKANSSS